MLDFVCCDDDVLISQNQAFLKNPANVKTAFTQHYFAAEYTNGRYYRPLVTLSFMTDTWIGKGAAWTYHATNVILFIGSCLLLFLLLVLIQTLLLATTRAEGNNGIWLPFLGSMLYAVHPLQAMAIAWIPGRNDTLLACFFLPSLWCFIKYRSTRILRYLWLHLISFSLALFTKEVAILIPALCLAWVFLIENKRDIRKWLDETPIFVWMGIGIGWFLFRGNALGLFMAGDPGPGGPLLTQVSVLAGLLTRYYGKIAFPLHLALLPDPDLTPIIYGLIFLVLVAIAFWRLKGLPQRLMVFGLLWSTGVLALSVPFSKSSDIRNLGLLEHRMVLSWAGVLIAWLVAANEVKWTFSKVWFALGVICLTLLASLSVNRIPDFMDPRTFWGKAVRESPNSSNAWHNYASVLSDDKRYEEAIIYFQRALRIDPDRQLSHLNLAYVYHQQHRYAEAIEECYKELDIAPYSEKACLSLFHLYLKVGNPSLAQKWREREQDIRNGKFVQPFKRNR
jgi:hypothetical protein